MPKPSRDTFPDQLRALIERSGRSTYELAHEAGVDRAALHRFRKGERDVGFESAGKLMEALGVEPLRLGRKVQRAKKPGHNES